jgi:[ribosomal protein S5]-alanine N-acetyltransferase
VKAPSEILTDRLSLSTPQATDATSIFERYASDPDVTRYLGWPRHRSLADTEAFLKFSSEEWERWPGGPYVIRQRNTGALIGATGLGFESQSMAVTGYVFAKDAWGKGYATEALAAVVDIARRIELAQLYALCHPEHQASWRVLEKCGFTRDASWSKLSEFPNLAPGILTEVFCYTMALGE